MTEPAGLYILTGAPGSGKTAILDQVGADIRRVDEPAREILAEQRALGGSGTHDRDPSLFVELLLRRSIDKHEAAQRWGGPTLFDRGVPDCIAYAVLMEIDPTPSLLASEVYRYHPEILILEPWEEIYSVERAGYVLVDVPRDSVVNRAAFVREFITR